MAEPGWQLDERGAWDYEKNLVAVFTDDWASDLLSRLAITPGAELLDIGTGTGIVARRAAETLGTEGRIEAVDVSPAMLAVAASLSSDSATPTSFTETPAESLPFGDEQFDFITAQQMLQFADAPGVLRECQRVARPGGSLGVATCRSLEHQPGYRVLVDCLAEHLGVEAAGIIASPYALGDTDELVRLVDDAGFTDLSTSILVTSTRFPSPAAFLEAEASSSPLGNVTQTLDDDVLRDLVADLDHRLSAHADSEGITFPFETITVTATAP